MEGGRKFGSVEFPGRPVLSVKPILSSDTKSCRVAVGAQFIHLLRSSRKDDLVRRSEFVFVEKNGTFRFFMGVGDFWEDRAATCKGRSCLLSLKGISKTLQRGVYWCFFDVRGCEISGWSQRVLHAERCVDWFESFISIRKQTTFNGLLKRTTPERWINATWCAIHSATDRVYYQSIGESDLEFYRKGVVHADLHELKPWLCQPVRSLPQQPHNLMLEQLRLYRKVIQMNLQPCQLIRFSPVRDSLNFLNLGRKSHQGS